MKQGCGGCLIVVVIVVLIGAFFIYYGHIDSVEAANCAKIGGVYSKAGIDSNSCDGNPRIGPSWCSGIVIPFTSDGSVDYSYANSALGDAGWQDCYNT